MHILPQKAFVFSQPLPCTFESLIGRPLLQHKQPRILKSVVRAAGTCRYCSGRSPPINLTKSEQLINKKAVLLFWGLPFRKAENPQVLNPFSSLSTGTTCCAAWYCRSCCPAAGACSWREAPMRFTPWPPPTRVHAMG